ncbi:MAG: CDP-glycerol glycerophosphotransferase family protein, partial [Treponema sp.]|nr:CDP-glycerol glycerophosphotransferase family protein [Treponema sp.]
MTLYVLFFLAFFAPPLFAYIDPGTGSMLFSFLTGIAVTAFFFSKNLLLKLKGGSLGRKKNKTQKGTSADSLVIYSEGKQYWNVFKPVVEELARRSIPCVYYTSSEDDPGLSFPSPLVRAEFIGKGNAAFRFLNFLEADICLMTTPGLDVLQLKRSPGVRHYAHILHMAADATTYRLFGLDYYDSIFLTGEYQKKDLRKLEELRGTARRELFVVGCSYLDVLSDHARELPAEQGLHKKTVLLAPSWGANGILRRYGLKLLEPLARSSYRVVIRPHPQSLISEKDTIESLRSRLDAFETVEWNFDAENLRALSRADALVSDFSGVIFDYAFLFGRPVLYPRFDFDKRPYDLADIEDEAWTFRAIRELGEAVDEEDFV